MKIFQRYRGAAHNQCNLNWRTPLILPVVFHNLQAYDSDLFINLPKSKENYRVFLQLKESIFHFLKKIKVGEYNSRKKGATLPIKFEIRFIDSFKFLVYHHQILFLIFNQQIKKILILILRQISSLLTRKGFYPYDY